MKGFRRNEGFTLVELMVVVLIIGVLVAIGVPVFTGARTMAQTKSCFGNQRTIEGACQMYTAANSSLPADGPVDNGCWAVPNYIRDAPYCPADPGRSAYSITAGTVDDCSYGITPHGHF
jgi:prepilin-type N-terminal cleavage/methylation domain-containing protein